MTRRASAWLAALALAALAGALAFRGFPSAFPIVTLTLTMDRGAALHASDSLASAAGWQPRGEARQAASFGGDDATQTFVELKAGGRDAWVRMMREDWYQPYTWRVRRFAAGDPNEVSIRFAPDGRPYGFAETLEEKAPGPALTADSARAIAERAAAAAPWRVDFSRYALVEQGNEARPGGRVDHTFTYERTDVTMGEGRVRLQLSVGGAHLTGLRRYVQVPESWERTYAELRSRNDGIAAADGLAIVLLYGAGGIGIGTFWLLRRRAALWRMPLVAGAAVSGLNALAAISSLPLAALGYDTALPPGTWLLQQALGIVGGFVAWTVVLALSFQAAEGLTRAAFPGKVQLWRSWGAEAGASVPIAGQTLAGYLLVPFFFLYVVLFYRFATHTLGWWSPSDALIQPDVLATWLPWVSAVGPSLQAGFWEECLFRAVPLAGAALIGDRMGNRRAWIAAAFVLQALVFGAGHANYPAQPSYARVVELILPSFLFGAVYLRYGLIAGIVMHFAYDLVWFAVPMFTLNAPGVWADRAMIVAAGGVPLLVVLWRRVQAGALLPLPDTLTNGGWVPPAVADDDDDAHAQPLAAGGAGVIAPLALGAAGVLMLALARPTPPVAPGMQVTRAEAIATAQQALRARGAVLPDGVRWLATVQSGGDEGARFVWQEGGPARYRALLGDGLRPPRWSVRAATWRGPVPDRADEWQVAVGADGAPLRVRHLLPEGRAGASLPEAAARDTARRAALALGVQAGRWVEVSAVPEKRPARTDWTFTWRDTMPAGLGEGQLRARVVVSGDVVTDMEKFVFVPEQWERADRAREATRGVLGICTVAVLVLLLGAGLVGGVLLASRAELDYALVVRVAGLFAGVALVSLLSGWPGATALFRTTQPFTQQAAIALAGGVVGALVSGAAMALVAGAARTWARPFAPVGPVAWWRGVMVGLAIVGFGAVRSMVARSVDAPSRDVGTWGGLFPWVPTALSPLVSWVLASSGLLLATVLLARITAGFRRRQALGLGIAVVAIFLAAAEPGRDPLASWAATGALAAAIGAVAWLTVLRHDVRLVLVATATVGVARLAPALRHPAWPGEGIAVAIGTAAMLVIAAVALRAWEQEGARARPA